MSFNLNDLMTYINNGQSPRTDTAASAASTSDAIRNARTAMALEALLPGQTISGVVKSVQGSQILLDLGEGVELTARLDQNMDIGAGKSLLFEVKSNQKGSVQLSPLYTNMSSGNSAAQAALKAAGLPLSSTNMTMVDTMTREGLSIDRSSLWEMNRLVSANPSASPESVVHLKAMGLPVNADNLTQFQNYQTQNYQMLQSIEAFSGAMEDAVYSFWANGQIAEGLQFMENMLGVFSQQGAVADADALGNSAQAELGQITGGIAGQQAVVEGSLNVLDAGNQGEHAGFMEQMIQTTGQDNRAALLATVSSILQEDGTAVRLQDSGAKLNEFMKQFGEFMQGKGDASFSREEYENIGKVFSKLFSEQIRSEWLMKPEDFGDKQKVKEFYQKLSQQTEKMNDVFVAAEKGSTAAGKAVTSLNQNLHFMNDLNQTFPYLQIPLKAAMENAHGDLYVYTKKHQGNATEDEPLTALLHLDMQHLGSMDVYVKLQKNQVNTHFTLEDDSIIDFLSAHMHVLDERLQAKGYQLDSAVTRKEAASGDVLEHIRGVSEKAVPVIMNSFDVRA